jgi:hypothetical protein
MFIAAKPATAVALASARVSEWVAADSILIGSASKPILAIAA